MRFNIKINKLANHYLFVSELSQWNELICHPQRKKEWIKKTGRLSTKEKVALENFSKILKEAKNNIGWIFICETEKNTWLKLKKQTGVEQTEELRNIFKLFENKFNILWRKESHNFDTISKYIKKNKNKINKNLEVLYQLSGVKINKNSRITIFLEMNGSENEAQGWSYEDKIILECSNWQKNAQLSYLVNCILLHELFHFIIKKNKKLLTLINKKAKKIKKYLPADLQNWDEKIIFEDLLLSSFVPEGFLSEKFCNINSRAVAEKELSKKKNDNFTKLRNMSAVEMYNIAKEYVDKKKRIDKNYIEKITDQIKKTG